MEDKWKTLFREIPMEIPSDDFHNKLMNKIEIEFVRKKQINQWKNRGMIAAGIAGIVFIPGLILFLCKIEFVISFASFKFPNIFSGLISLFKGLYIDPTIVAFGFTILILLIGDTLFRKLAKKRKGNRIGHPEF